MKTNKQNQETEKGLMQRLKAIGTIPKRDIVEFTRHFAVMMKAGLTVQETLDFLAQNTKNPAFLKMIKKIILRIQNGQALSQALSHYPKRFDEVYVSIIRVGESTGTLPESMENLADQMESHEFFRKKVKGALIYPKVILVTMLAFVVLLAVFVMPRLVSVFDQLDVPIPTSTKVILSLSDFIRQEWAWVLIGVATFVISVKKLGKKPRVRRFMDRAYLRIPVAGRIIRHYNTAQVAKYFGAMFLSGLNIIHALEITRHVVASTVFKEELEEMITRIESGAELSASFVEKSAFPPMFVKMIRVGERTGKMSDVVRYVGNYYERVVDNDVKNITSAIEPFIIAVIGLLIAGLVITVIGPIYELIGQVTD